MSTRRDDGVEIGDAERVENGQERVGDHHEDGLQMGEGVGELP